MYPCIIYVYVYIHTYIHVHTRMHPQVWAADRAGRVTARNGKTGQIIAAVETPRSSFLVWCMILLETDVWMGSETGPVLVYDRFDRTFVCELRMHVGGVYCMAANRDRSRVYTGSNDFTGRLLIQTND